MSPRTTSPSAATGASDGVTVGRSEGVSARAAAGAPPHAASDAVHDFLVSRRDRLTPEDLGLPRGRRRRVPGLRREEVAALAGVSLDYYIQIERGSLRGVSPEVLTAIATALRLDDAERAYLEGLAETAQDRPGAGARAAVADIASAPEVPEVPDSLRSLVDAAAGVAVLLVTPQLDVLAWNRLAQRLLPGVFSAADGLGIDEPSLARFVFTDPRAREYYADWEAMATDAAGMLRIAEAQAKGAGRRAVASLVDELHASSADFSRLWADHHVVLNRRGVKTVHVDPVGTFDVGFEVLGASPAGDSPLDLVIYSPCAGDEASAAAMAELAAL